MTQNITSESHQIDSVTEIPNNCRIHDKHPFFIKIQTYLRGAAPFDRSSVKKMSLYVELPNKIQFWQTWDEDDFVVFDSVNLKFLSPLEIGLIIRETNNRQITCAEKSDGLKTLNFVNDLKADPRIFNSPEFKEIKISKEKEIELFNIANQAHSALVKLPLEQQIEEVAILEARLKLGRDLLFSQGIRIKDAALTKSKEEAEQERLNRANGFKTNKQGKLVPLAKAKVKSNKNLDLKLKYGSTVVKFVAALNGGIVTEENCIKYSKQLNQK